MNAALRVCYGSKTGSLALSYHIRFRKSAKPEIKWLRDTYGQDFGEAWDEWTSLLAERAEKKDGTGSVDLVEILEDATELFDQAERSKLGQLLKKRWDEASFWAKVKAVLVALKKRAIPWQVRYSTRTLYCLGAGIPIELEILYEIDHVGQRVVILKVAQVDGTSRSSKEGA